MTCRMAAGKQKKRLINSSNPEQYKPGKKTKFHSFNSVISLKSQIGLEWDDYQKRVVPKKEQVGILWSDMVPFIESSKNCSGLADVTYVPHETFSLENMRGVLSYEVWKTCLTEAERKFLIQFLPSEADTEENVSLLLTGKNHHFGNPFLSWSSSLCHGDVHPDAVISKEKEVRANEKAYRINLRNYHSSTVETLKKWRKTWLGRDDLEKMFRDNPSKQKQGDIRSKASKTEIHQKAEMNGDVSTYMSYIEVSRTQHNLVKSLKHSGDGIQTKHLTRVIGDLDKFDVKPYSTLIEDEQGRLRKHWLNISCNDLPAAFEVLRDRKMLIEKIRKLVSLELAEKNILVMRKADQLADIRKELGQNGACENDDNPDLQNDQVEHSPSDVLLYGNNHNPSLHDRNEEETNCMQTSMVVNAKHDLMVVNGTDITSRSENSDVQDHGRKDACGDTTIIFCANNPDEQNRDLMDHPDEPPENLVDVKLGNDAPNVQIEGIKEIRHKNTAINGQGPESEQIMSINYAGTPVHTIDSQNINAEDIEGISYTSASIQSHEQDQGLKSNCYTVIHDNGHGVHNIPPAKIDPGMSTVAVDEEEVENITMIPSNRSPVLLRCSDERTLVDNYLDVNDQAVQGEKKVMQLAVIPDSYYHPPGNSIYNDSDHLEIRHGNLSVGQQGSVVYSENDILNPQQAQVTVASAFPMNSSVSFMQPCANQQNNSQLHTVASSIGPLSYSFEHTNGIAQSTDLHSLVNNRLAKSAQFPIPVQQQQLIDERHNSLYMQQLQKNLYSRNHHIAKKHSFATSGPAYHRYDRFPEEHQSHNNWSGIEPYNSLTQSFTGGSNIDGTLISALAPYKQPSAQMQSLGSNPSQLFEISNQVRPAQNYVSWTHGTNSQVSNIYGYTQNMPGSQSSHIAPVGPLKNMQWTNIIQQNPGKQDFINRQFPGP